jgi:hypothetical protein
MAAPKAETHPAEIYHLPSPAFLFLRIINTKFPKALLDSWLTEGAGNALLYRAFKKRLVVEDFVLPYIGDTISREIILDIVRAQIFGPGSMFLDGFAKTEFQHQDAKRSDACLGVK